MNCTSCGAERNVLRVGMRPVPELLCGKCLELQKLRAKLARVESAKQQLQREVEKHCEEGSSIRNAYDALESALKDTP